MSGAVHERKDISPYSSTTEIEPSLGSLVVHLRLKEQTCIVSFSGAITDKTRVTLDGVAELIAGEDSVVLDFSRIDVVNRAGMDAVDILVHSVLSHGAHLRMTQPKTRMGKAFRTQAWNYRFADSMLPSESNQ
jgi:anti-anti-sigma regulatory factor